MDNAKGQAPPFVKILLVNGSEVQVQTNCPPATFYKMMNSATETIMEQYAQQEQGQAKGILVPPPGTRIG